MVVDIFIFIVFVWYSFCVGSYIFVCFFGRKMCVVIIY